MSDSCENSLETELESLEAIYINELTYSRNSDGTVNQIELLLHPATGHDITKQYVCMTLVFTLSSKYPDEPPEIEIRNPRGLGEEEIASLVEVMIVKAEDMRDEAMLYTLIEMAKDSLTDGNIPHCPCVVCLEHFHDPGSFHRTACYHYFHTQCLYKYLLHTRAQFEEKDKEPSERRHLEISSGDKSKAKQIMCPVCRAPLDDESLAVTCSPRELEEDEKAEEFVIPSSLKEQQLKMAELYELQKAKGGIIDLEHEKNKYLVNPEDRMPIRSLTLVPEDNTNKLQKKHDAGESKKDKSKWGASQGSSSQHYRNKDRSCGHGGRSHQERYSHDKSRLSLRSKTVESTENKVSHSSGGGIRKVIEKSEESGLKEVTNDFSEGREALSEKDGGERKLQSVRKMMDRDDSRSNGKIDSENSRVRERGMSDQAEDRQLNKDSWAGDVSSIHFEHGNKESEKQKDGRSNHDGYRNAQSVQRGTSVRTEDRRRGGDNHGRGRYAEGGYQRYVPQYRNENVNNEDRQWESIARKEMKKGKMKGGTNVNSKDEDQSSMKEYEINGGFGNKKSVDGVREKTLEKRGENRNDKSTDESKISFATSRKEEDRHVRSDKSRASGFDRHYERGKDIHFKDDNDDEYRRDDKDGQQRMRRYYDYKESKGYHRGGGGGQRGRGSGSGQKNSKFDDRRGGNTEHSGRAYDRPYQHHSYQYHQQHRHHHIRQGEERERVDRSTGGSAQNRDVNGQNTEESVRGAYGTDAASETGGAQDEEEEEADLWKQVASPHYQSSHLGCTGHVTEGNLIMKESTVVCLQLLDADTINDTSVGSHGTCKTLKYDWQRENGGPERLLKKSVGCTPSVECNKEHKINCPSNFNYVADNEIENWDSEIDIYEYERYMIRPKHLEEYNRQGAARKKYYEDKVKERCVQQRALESRKVAEAGSHKHAKLQGYTEDPPKQKSVLELFKEEQAMDSTDSVSLRKDNRLLLETREVPSEDAKFGTESDNRLKRYQQNICNMHSILEENGQSTCASLPCCKKLTNSLDLDKNVFVGENKNKPEPYMHNYQVDSARLIRCEHTEEHRSQFGLTVAEKSGNRCKSEKVSSIIAKDIDKVMSFYSTSSNKALLAKGDCSSLLFAKEISSVSPLESHFVPWLTKSLISDKSTFNQDSGTFLKDSCTLHKDSGALHKDSGTFLKDSCTLHKDSCTLHKDSGALHKDSCTLHKDSGTFLKDSCTLHKDSGALHKDEYSSSLNTTEGSSLENSSVAFCTDSLVSDKVAADKNTLHKDRSALHKDSCTLHKDRSALHKDKYNDIPQSFTKKFRKAPPLKFSKKEHKDTNKDSPLCPVSQPTVTKERFQPGEALVSGPYHQEEMGSGWNKDITDVLSLSNNNVPPQTTSSPLNTGLSPNVQDLSANLLSSYETSCLISANLLNSYQNGFGLNPNLLSLYSACVGNEDNFYVSDASVLNHINAHNICVYNNSNITNNKQHKVSDANGNANTEYANVIT